MTLDLTQGAEAAQKKATELFAELNKSELGLEAAKYAKQGWRVFPLTPRSKVPLKDSRGLLEATTDLEQIKKWWGENPDYNIGLATGGGLVVLDVDPEAGGVESMAELTIPETRSVITGSGGIHFYFKTDKEIRNTASKIAGVKRRGLDIRGDGGYVVAPPSVHPSGGAYSWAGNEPFASWPFPVEDLHLATSSSASPDGELIPIGGRNDALTRLAGAMRRQGATQAEIEEALIRANESRNEVPLPEPEVRAIAKSVSRYDPAPIPDTDIMARTASDFLSTEVADPAWLVEGLWPESAIGFVAGPPKSFKSFYVLEMAAAISSGKPFLNRFGVPAPKRVLLIQSESPYKAFQQRVRNTSAIYGHSDDLFIISNKPLSLENDEDKDRIANDIRAIRPALVIFDPLRSFIDSDENSNQAMGQVVKTVRKWRDEFGTGFCIVHHTRKTDPSTTRGGDSMAGAGALFAAVEAAAWLRRVGDDIPRSSLKFELKEGQPQEPMTVQYGNDGLRVIHSSELLGEALRSFSREPHWNGDDE